MLANRSTQLSRSSRLLQTAQRPSAAAPACSAWGCRNAHKLVEVELREDCIGLGVRGDRIPVAPGRARSLLKEGRSLYVDRKGLAVSPMRDMLRKISRQESVHAERERLVRESLAPVEPVVEVDPHEVTRAAETDLRVALSLVPTPLTFHRRLIHAPSAPALPGQPLGGSSDIFGSVSVLDVVASLREFGVVVDEAVAAFEEGPGVEKGRLKSTGVYSFVVQLKALGESTSVEVEVLREL